MFLDQLWQELRVRIQPLYEPLGADENGSRQPPAFWQQLIPRGRRRLIAILAIVFVFVSGLALVSHHGVLPVP